MNSTPFLTHDFQRVLEVVDYTNPSTALSSWESVIHFITEYQPPEEEKGGLPMVFAGNLKIALEKLCKAPAKIHQDRGYLAFVVNGTTINLEPIRELIRHYHADSHSETSGVQASMANLLALSAMLLDYVTEENVKEYQAAAQTVNDWSLFFYEIHD